MAEKMEKPTLDFVKEVLKRREKELKRHYDVEGKVLDKIINKYPENNNLEAVLAKITLIDAFYSTQIQGRKNPKDNKEALQSGEIRLQLVEFIVKTKDFDKRLKSGDLNLVIELANATKTTANMRFHSFASKYIAIHSHILYDDRFPISDNLVREYLADLQRVFHFTQKLPDRDDYIGFVKIIDDFRESFGLKSLSYRKIDMYLWGYKRLEQIRARK